MKYQKTKFAQKQAFEPLPYLLHMSIVNIRVMIRLTTTLAGSENNLSFPLMDTTNGVFLLDSL